jgi:hypothetical protein
MSVYKVKDRPGFRYDFWLQGHRVRGVAETENRKEAEKVEKAARDAKREELKAGTKPAGVVMRIDEATDCYNREVAQHLAGQGADIVFRDLERLEAYFKDVLGEGASFTAINDAEIAKLVAGRMQRPKNPYSTGGRQGNILLWETRGRRFKSSRYDQ